MQPPATQRAMQNATTAATAASASSAAARAAAAQVAAAAASAAEEANKIDCPLAALSDSLLDAQILRHLPEARDRAALARCCRALRRAVSWYEDARVVVASGSWSAQLYGIDPAVSSEQRWRWAGHAAARTRGLLTLVGFSGPGGDIQRLRGIAVAGCFHPRLRELATPGFCVGEGDVRRLRSAAGAALPAASHRKVHVFSILNPDAAWMTTGPGDELRCWRRSTFFKLAAGIMAPARPLPPRRRFLRDARYFFVGAINPTPSFRQPRRWRRRWRGGRLSSSPSPRFQALARAWPGRRGSRSRASQIGLCEPDWRGRD